MKAAYQFLNRLILAAVLSNIFFFGVGTAQTSGKWITTYYPTWMFRSSSQGIYYAIPPWNMKFEGITHVIQFGNVNISTTPPYFTPMWGSDSLEWAYGTSSNGESQRTYYRDSLVSVAHRQGARVLICIQAAQSGTALNYITQDSIRTDDFARNVAGFVERHGYDGVDVNWETNVGNKTQTSLLIRRLRYHLERIQTGDGGPPVITLSPLSGGWGNYDATTCNQNVDQINPQCYDLSDAWNANIGQNGNWFLNPLHEGSGRPSGFEGKSYETRGPLQWISNGFSRDILGLGVAAFGRIYTGNTNLYQGHSGRYEIGMYDVNRYLALGMTEVWDSQRAAHYAQGTSTASFTIQWVGTVPAGTSSFVTYMSPPAVDSMTTWVVDQDLGGVMIYDMSYDADKSKPYGETNAIHNMVVEALGSVSLPPDSTPPSVTLTSPVNGATLSGVVNLSATASDNQRVVKVEFLVDNQVVGTDFVSPFTYLWNSIGQEGPHSVAAKATDRAGNTTTTAAISISVIAPPPDTIKPVVSVTAPSNGANVTGIITITASASDNIGITRVEIFIDGVLSVIEESAPYTTSWNTYGLSGSHTIQAKAFDAAGNSTTSALTIITVTSLMTDTIMSPAILRDDFNAPDAPIHGTKRWSLLDNMPGDGTFLIQDSTMVPYSTATEYPYGGLMWDTLMTGGSEVSIRIRQKANNYGYASLFLYARMNSKDYTTATGYRLRFWERSGTDRFEISKVGPGLTTFSDLGPGASWSHEVRAGDVITFRVSDDNRTMAGYVNDTRVVYATDSTYKPSQWYFGMLAAVFPTQIILDDFRVSTRKLPTRGSISGTVFFDADGNGVKGSLEEGISGWRVRLDGLKTDSLFTDASGNYSFPDLQFGSYTVTPGQRVSWSQTLPAGGASYSVSIDSLNAFATTSDFGLYTSNAFSFPVDRLWNIVSVPVLATEVTKKELFPTSVSQAFVYGEGVGYTQKDTLQNGPAYWLKFNNIQKIWMAGSPITADTIDVIPGWNFMGSVSAPVPVAYLYTNPVGILAPYIYGYSRGHIIADTIKPGRGYWIFASQSGKVMLSSLFSPAATEQQPPFSMMKQAALEEFDYLSFTTANGEQQKVYLSTDESKADVMHWLQMPPPPPDGMLDVRLTSSNAPRGQGTLASVIPLDGKPIVTLRLQSNSYPIRLEWNIHDPQVEYALANSMFRDVVVRGSGEKLLDEIATEEGVVSFRLTARTTTASEKPSRYFLEQNYPNPFNGNTIIRFGLPEESDVVVDLYSTLGEKVATILSAHVGAGIHTVPIDANKLAGGVYFYRLSVRTPDGILKHFTQKMLLMK